jgi:hypothetical protein
MCLREISLKQHAEMMHFMLIDGHNQDTSIRL